MRLIFLLLLLPFVSFGRKFYFSSSTGSDSRTLAQAQDSTTPWQTLAKLQYFAQGINGFTTYPNKAGAGDTICFKRGDIFANGLNQSFGSVKWWRGISGYNCASGTPGNPIVLTYYGDITRPRPNLLFPFPTSATYNQKYVLTFEGVNNFVIDGLQFNDYRFSDTAKVQTAYTSSAFLLGEYSNGNVMQYGDSANNGVRDFKITNCVFNRIGYAILSAGRNIEVSYNIATNLKSVGDTSGSTDIGADFMVPYGPRYKIHHNFVSGSWFYTSGTGGGVGGGVFECADNFDSSFIGYNTLIDNDACFEIGSIYDNTAGCNEDTVAYNLMINNKNISYIHTGGQFGGFNSKWHFWNNTIVENTFSRRTGVNFGSDIPGYDTDTLGNINIIGDLNYWNFPLWVGGSNNCGPFNPAPCGTVGQPLNPSIPFSQCPGCNNANAYLFQYPNDNNIPGDTLYDIRNNIIWIGNNLRVFYDSVAGGSNSVRTKQFHRDNLIRIASGGVTTGQLSVTDFITTNMTFTDTSNINPYYWDYNLNSSSPAISAGYYTGISTDKNGNPVGNPPSIGAFEYIAPTPPPTPTGTLRVRKRFQSL